MPRISEDTIQSVAVANDIVEVIGGYLQLKRAGSNFKGLCPFHNEKTPSFLVNPGRQTYKCFGCGAGGGVFKFVMDYENVDYPTAIRKLAARANITIAEESEEEGTRKGERDRLVTLHRDAAAWFHENLMRQKFAAHAREYLQGRGIGSEVAVRWKLGYAPDSWDALTFALRAKGYSNDEILKSGVVIAKESEKFYDRFRNRVMFPISNDYAEIIGFSGRTLGDDPAKYVNSPETPIFTKGRVLFGLEKTKRAILAANEAVVCEGQLDLISAFEAGVENVTAPQGTAFTSQQARLIHRFAESVVLCFDSDAAGRKAVERSLPALLAENMTVRVARVPAGEDPDTLVRNQGADALRAVITEARDYFDNALEEELKPGATPQQRAALARKLAGFVKLILDPALREPVIARVRSRLELTDAAFATLLKSAPLPNPDHEPEVVAEIQNIVLPESARILIRLAISLPKVRAWIKEQPESATILGSEYILLHKIACSDFATETPGGFAEFCATLSDGEANSLVELRLRERDEDEIKRAQSERRRPILKDMVRENAFETAVDAWKGLFQNKLKADIAVLRSRMNHPDTPFEEVSALHKQILDLQGRLIHV